MRYTSKGKLAWCRNVGKGRVYAYFGPMDLRQREDSWMLAYNLPLRFLKDGIQDSVRDGLLGKAPLSLNLTAQDVYLVETQAALMALNISESAKKVGYPGGTFEIPGQSLLKIRKP